MAECKTCKGPTEGFKCARPAVIGRRDVRRVCIAQPPFESVLRWLARGPQTEPRSATKANMIGLNCSFQFHASKRLGQVSMAKSFLVG